MIWLFLTLTPVYVQSSFQMSFEMKQDLEEFSITGSKKFSPFVPLKINWLQTYLKNQRNLTVFGMITWSL
jgi:hypothetical protein